MVLVDLPVKTDFGQFWPKKTGFVRFCPEKLGFDRKHWFWSIVAGKTGFGRFWPDKLVLVDLDRKN